MPRLSISSSQVDSDRDRTPSVKRKGEDMSPDEASSASDGEGGSDSANVNVRASSRKKSKGEKSKNDDQSKKETKPHKWSNKDEAFFARMRKEFFDPMDVKQDAIKKEVEGMRNDMDNVMDRVKALEDREGEGYARMKEELKSELLEEIDKKGELGYQLHLQQEIAKYAPNIIVSGLGSGEPIAALKEVASVMKIPVDKIEAINIKKVFPLGKQQENRKPPPKCFVLGSIEDRQLFFDHAKNLPKESNVYFDKDVPLSYRSQYKKYKQKAKKERDFLDRHTRISFVGHIMQLKVRDSPNESWTILHEYYPSQKYYKSLMSGKGNKVEGGELPPRLDNSKVDTAKKMIRVINYPESEITHLNEEVRKVIGSPLAKKVTSCFAKRKVATISCADTEATKAIKKALVKAAPKLRGKLVFYETLEA